MAGVSNYEPYASNAEGLTQVLIDLKDTMAGKPLMRLLVLVLLRSKM